MMEQTVSIQSHQSMNATNLWWLQNTYLLTHVVPLWAYPILHPPRRQLVTTVALYLHVSQPDGQAEIKSNNHHQWHGWQYYKPTVFYSSSNQVIVDFTIKLCTCEDFNTKVHIRIYSLHTWSHISHHVKKNIRTNK